MKIACLVIAVCVAAANANFAPLMRNEDRITGRYIISIKPESSLDDFVSRFDALNLPARVEKTFRNVVKAVAVSLPEQFVDRIRKMEGVEYIEEDGIYRSQVTWGLDRTDQVNLPLDNRYNVESGTGVGVNVYVIDGGVLPTHRDFGGRAFAWYDAFGEDGVDCNGHGTHCAGTVGSNTFGVAPGANIYGVRVLTCIGQGSLGTIIDGMDYVLANGTLPAVVSMSLGGRPSPTFDDAIEALTNASFTVSVAAGNDNTNACNYSPARAASAITVGATDREDRRAGFSNYGPCVDIFAPGVDITSTWYTSIFATNILSGTSMSCPHVAGAAAIILGNNSTMSPAEVTAALVFDATDRKVSNPGFGSANELLFVN